MAKTYFDRLNEAYKENSNVTNARNTLVAFNNNMPQYTDTYAGQLQNIYGQIKNGKDFYYNPENDAAYRQYADQYRALVGLAVAGNQAQAQDLTGGYGSTYAPEVARQGEVRLNAGVEAAQPAFYQLAQNKYMADNDLLYDKLGAGLTAQQTALTEYGRKADAWNDRYQRLANTYETERDTAYANERNKREWLSNMYAFNSEKSQAAKDLAVQKYEVYNNLAANKCADYNKKGDNKGMKKYLDGLVKKGKLTPYMADNLYKQYKYEAPKASGGGGGGGRRRGSGGRRYYGGGGGTTQTNTAPAFDSKNGNDNTDDWIIAHDSNHNRRVTYDGLLAAVNSDEKAGRLTAEEAAYLRSYIKAGNMAGDYTDSRYQGNHGGASGRNLKRNMTR